MVNQERKPISQTCEPNYDFIKPTMGNYNIGEPVIKEYGWICPKCGAVMSPREKFCAFCQPSITDKFTC